jgi:hypothetical protein
MWIKSLLCHLFTGHDWQRMRTVDDQTYLECRRCGMDGDLTEAFYGSEANPRAPGPGRPDKGFFA